MGHVNTYTSNFHFLRRIWEHYEEVARQHIRFFPENRMKSSFIRIDETSVNQLENVLVEDYKDLSTTLEVILSTKVKNPQQNSDLGEIFQTDGVQVKLHHVIISERQEWVTVKQANYDYSLRYSVLEHAYSK